MTHEEIQSLTELLTFIQSGNYHVKTMTENMRKALVLVIKHVIEANEISE